MEALNLPTARWATTLVQALLDGTFNAIEWLNKTAQGGIELREGDLHQQDPIIERANGRTAVRFPQGELRGLRPRDLALDALRAMCGRHVPDNAAATSGELFAFIDGVDAIEDERLRSLFTKYVNQVTLASSKTEQLEDYYWQREDDI